jgi:hypothetical protein
MLVCADYESFFVMLGKTVCMMKQDAASEYDRAQGNRHFIPQELIPA